MKKVKIFYGRQFVSAHESSAKMSDAVRRSLEDCADSWNKQFPSRTVSFERIDSDIGQGELLPQILELIRKSDIGIFNVTDTNENVIFELGYSEGRCNPNIWICNRARPFERLPADFRGRFLMVYQNEEDLKTSLTAELERRLEQLFGLDTPERAFHEIWNLDDYSKLYKPAKARVVAAPLPEADQARYAKPGNPNFLKMARFADIDAVFELSKFLMRNFDFEVEEITSDRVQQETREPTFLIGSPLWNRAARPYYAPVGKTGSPQRVPIHFKEGPAGEDDAIIWEGRELIPEPHSASDFADIGFFARLTSSAKGLPVFLISGCRTFGVLGATKCFSNTDIGRQNAKFIIDKLGYQRTFCVAFRVRVYSSVVQIPDLGDPQDFIGLLPL